MTTLAAISLLTPALFALGALGLSLPVIAHLLNRRARKRVTFPTIRLLEASSASQSGLFKMRRLLLLLVRSLAVLAIALAFARPMWVAGESAADPDAGVSVVIVFDNSASSAMRADGVRVIDALRSTASRVLDDLIPGRDRVNVVFAEARPRAMFPQMTANPQAVRTDLETVDPTLARGDLIAAVGSAGQMLQTQAGQRRIVVISDLQQTNWADVLDRATLGTSLAPGVQLTVLPFALDVPDNVALARPRLDPPRPIAGQPAQAIVTVHNYSMAARDVTVSLNVDGATVTSQRVQIAARAHQDVSFTIATPDRGQHAVAFSVDGRNDAWETDNRASAVFRAVSRVPVLVIGDDDPESVGSVSYFVTRALAPLGDERDELEVRHAHTAAVDPVALTDVDLVFVTAVGRLTTQAAQAIKRYVHDGGGVVWLSDDGPVVENMAMLDSVSLSDDQATPFAPAAPQTWRDLSQRDEPLRISAGAWGSRVLGDMDASGREALRRVAVRRAWSFATLRQDTTALLRFDDDSPAMLARPFGQGRFVIVAFSPDQRSSDIARHAVFVALMQSLARYARVQAGQELNAVVGQPYTWSIPTASSDPSAPTSNAPLRVVGPDDEPVDAQLAVQPSGVSAYLSDPAQPGIYRVKRDRETLAMTAVNLDARESDPRRVDIDRLSALAVPGSAVNVATGDSIDVLGDARGRNLWHWLIVAAMAAMAVELVMLIVWKR